MKNKCTRPEIPLEEMPVTMVLNEVSRMFHDEMRVRLESMGLKNGYRHLMFHLIHEENLTQLDLVKRTHLKAPTVSVALAKMEAEGLIVKTPDPSDARQTRITLTDKARALDEELKKCIDENDKRFTQCLTAKEQGELKRLLWKMRCSVIDDK